MNTHRSSLTTVQLKRIGLLATFLVPLVTQAAEPADHLNLQRPTRPGYLAPKSGEVFQLPPVAPMERPAPAIGEETVLIERVVFRGNQVVPSGDLEALAAPYVGKRLGIAEVEELRQKLTRFYIDKGYINSGAMLSAQPIAARTLTFDIIEGHIQSIQLRGMERLDDRYITNRLVRRDKEVLNIDTLRERFQLLLGDPLFERLNARLIPAEQLGQAVLDVDVARARPYQLSMAAHNYRAPSIGENVKVVSGSVRNLTGFGDLVEASVQGDNHQGIARGSLNVRMPLNQRGTQLSVQLDHGRSSIIEEPLQTLDIKSTLDSKDVGLNHTFFETLQHKMVVGIHRVSRENRTTLLDQPFSFIPGEPDGVTKLSSWRFWQEYSHRAEKQVIALRSTFTSSTSNLQATPGLPIGATVPERQYKLWLGQAQYARQVMENGAQFVVRGTLQYSPKHILALDQMSIGGVSTVRGFRENQMIRDNGTVLNFEFDYPLLRNSGAGPKLNLISFFDLGQGRNVNDGTDRISSVGVATRLTWKGLFLDLAVAHRLSEPDFASLGKGSQQDRGIHFQLGYNFFGH
jgi:hemolysin activation/secretion protein